MSPCFAHPRSPPHDQIAIAIIVVVGVGEVETADLAFETGSSCAVTERAISTVVEVTHLIAQASGRGDQIQETVAVEIVHYAAAGVTCDRHPRVSSNIWEKSDITF